MGMVAELEQITPEKLAEFVENPRLAYEQTVGSDLDELMNHPESGEIVSKMIEQMRDIRANKGLPPSVRAEMERVAEQMSMRMGPPKGPKLVTSPSKSERKRFSLQKDWHVLHYVLNGTAEGGDGPLSDAILGGKEIPDVDKMMGYGPLRYLDSLKVKNIADALTHVDPKQLTSKLNKADAESKRIYLAHTLDHPGEWDYLPVLFEQFRDFYLDAAGSGSAIILQIA